MCVCVCVCARVCSLLVQCLLCFYSKYLGLFADDVMTSSRLGAGKLSRKCVCVCVCWKTVVWMPRAWINCGPCLDRRFGQCKIVASITRGELNLQLVNSDSDSVPAAF